MWYMTYDMLHVKWDMWQMGVRQYCVKKFRSIACKVLEQSCFEGLEEKDDWFSNNDVCKTALTTPGILTIIINNLARLSFTHTKIVLSPYILVESQFNGVNFQKVFAFPVNIFSSWFTYIMAPNIFVSP